MVFYDASCRSMTPPLCRSMIWALIENKTCVGTESAQARISICGDCAKPLGSCDTKRSNPFSPVGAAGPIGIRARQFENTNKQHPIER